MNLAQIKEALPSGIAKNLLHPLWLSSRHIVPTNEQFEKRGSQLLPSSYLILGCCSVMKQLSWISLWSH